MVSASAPAAPNAAVKTTSEAALLETRALTKSYPVPGRDDQQIHVLRGIDLKIHRGEMISIVGQSGVGKSTLLQILGTLDHPTSGEILFDVPGNGAAAASPAPINVFGLPPAKLSAFRNAHIGFVFQFHHLLAEFTALENVMLPLLIAGQKPKVAEATAAEYLAYVGLASRIRHKPGELSGGEAQRVAIARALVRRPDIVFADEPTGNLDTKTSDEIHGLLVELNARLRTAFVVVTHNVKLAWMLERHLLLADGVVRELRTDEAPEEFLPKRDHA